MKLELFVTVIGVIAILGMGAMHEQAHVQTFRHYGINSTVDYFGAFPNFRTIPDEPCPTPECVLSNNINDNFSYVLLPLAGFLVVLSVIFVSFLDSINNKLGLINYMAAEELGYETK